MRFFVGMFALLGCLVTVPVAAQKKDVVAAPARLTPPLTTDTQNLLLLDLSTGGRVTIWLRPDVALQPIASRLVKEIALYGGDIAKFVPEAVRD